MKKAMSLLSKNSAFIILGVLALLPLLGMSDYQFYMIARGLQNSLVTLSLVILLGFTGQLSLGHAGLVAVGAYTFGIMTVNWGLSPWLALIVGPVLAGLIGVVLGVPSFKLSGPFLVVITIAFGEIIRLLILNAEITGGPFGLRGIRPMLGRIQLYYFMLAVVALVTLLTIRLKNSFVGLALQSIRDDEVAAEIMGVNIRKYKLIAFVISASLAGLSGVLFANLTGYLNPDTFTFNMSATFLLTVVMGGMTSPTGAILSSIVVTSLPEILRFLERSRMVFYGLVLFIYIRYASSISGFFGNIFGKKKTASADK